MERKTLVEAAGTIALQIERHVPIAERLECSHHCGADLGIERTRHLVAGNFDAGHLLVMTDSIHAKAERTDRLLGQLDRA